MKEITSVPGKFGPTALAITKVARTPTVVTSAANGTIVLIPARAGAESRTLKYLPPKPVNVIASISDADEVLLGLTGRSSGAIEHVNLDTGNKTLRLNSHMATVTGLGVFADGSRFASCSADGTLRSWQIEAGICEHTYEAAESKFVGLRVNTNGFICYGYDRGKVLEWDATSGKLRNTHEVSSPDCNLFTASFTLSRLFSVDSDNPSNIRVFAPTGSLVMDWGTAIHEARVTALTCWQGKLVSADADGNVIISDISNGKPIAKVSHGEAVTGVAVSSDHKTIASVSDSKLVVWSTN